MKDIITVDFICSRYGVERHKAATILYKLPFFRLGNRLYAYAEDLEKWEQGQMVYPVAKGVRKPKETPYLIPRRKTS